MGSVITEGVDRAALRGCRRLGRAARRMALRRGRRRRDRLARPGLRLQPRRAPGDRLRPRRPLPRLVGRGPASPGRTGSRSAPTTRSIAPTTSTTPCSKFTPEGKLLADAGHERMSLGHRRDQHRLPDDPPRRPAVPLPDERGAGRGRLAVHHRRLRQRPRPQVLAGRPASRLVGRAGRRAGAVPRAARHRRRTATARSSSPTARTAASSSSTPTASS